MPSSYTVINAPLQITANMDTLVGAIGSARPGTVITVTVATTPRTINLSGIAKSGYGVCVKLPSTQIVRITATGATSNIHFFGGKISADEVTGERLASNYGLSVESGCSKISVKGALFGENVNSVVVNQASDILVDTCRFTLSRADHAQTPTTARMQMSGNAFDSGAKGAKFCYYPDGRAPDHNISQSVCAVNGGTWEDSAHNDIWQFRTGCSDIIAINNICNVYQSQGFVTFGTAIPGQPLNRCLVANNEINEASAHGINVTGTNVEIRDNAVAVSPDAEVAPRITVARAGGVGTIYGGRNTAPLIVQPSGVDLGSGTLNGDVVDPPVPPNIILPAWAPDYTMPSAVAEGVPVRITGVNGIKPGGVPSTGTWLSVNRGQWTGTVGITWAYRWTRNGTPISGATNQMYQVTALDAGQSLGVEVRGTNALGTGLWYAYTPVVPLGVITGTLEASDESPTIGSTVTLTVTMSSIPVGSYIFQHRRNGTNIPGATTNPLSITNWQEANNGSYDCVVTDTGNSDTRAIGPVNVVAASDTLRIMVMGQSELEYLFNAGPFYTAIPYSTDYGDGNVTVITQGATDAAPVMTTVNAASVSAETVNPAIAAMSALFDYVIPGINVVIGDGCVAGTSRSSLYNDSNLDRKFSDFTSVVNLIESTYGAMSAMVECWYNSDASNIINFKEVFWPFYFGRTHTDGDFTLGTSGVDHCLWDGAAALGVKGRGIFARNVTNWHVLTPMPFHDTAFDPDPEMVNFSAGGLRLSEPRRQIMIDLAGDELAQSVNLVVGPSAHVTNFGGGIHPQTDDPDGQILLAWPVAIAILREAGVTIGEPTIVGTEGPTDGTYVDVLVDLPNGGTLTTLREFREAAMPGTPSPHQQEVTGFELSRSARRPIFRTAETSYPIAHRGTVVIQDTGTGTAPTRRGRVRITPETPFEFGNTVSYLRGQASGHILEPRDVTNKIYLDMLVEHVPALYNPLSTYPFEGIAVRPYQAELPMTLDEPSFVAMSSRFNGTNSGVYGEGLTFPTTNQFTLSVWFYLEGTWNTPTGGGIIELRNGASGRLSVYTASSGRLTLASTGPQANFITPLNGLLANRWNHMLWTINANDGAGSRNQISLNGGAAINGPSVESANLYWFTTAPNTLWFGQRSAARWSGDIGHLWLDCTQSLDLTVQANREKFILAGAPVDLGSTGQLPLGSTPALYFNGGAAVQNLGTAGTPGVITNVTAGSTPLLP